MLDDRAVDDELMRRSLGAGRGGFGDERLQDGVLKMVCRSINIEHISDQIAGYRSRRGVVIEG